MPRAVYMESTQSLKCGQFYYLPSSASAGHIHHCGADAYADIYFADQGKHKIVGGAF